MHVTTKIVLANFRASSVIHSFPCGILLVVGCQESGQFILSWLLVAGLEIAKSD